MELGCLVNIAGYGFHVYAGKTDKQHIFYDLNFNRVYFPFDFKRVKYDVKPRKVDNHRHFDVGNKIFCLQVKDGKTSLNWCYYLGSNNNFIHVLMSNGLTDKKLNHNKNQYFFRYESRDLQTDSLRKGGKVQNALHEPMSA